MAFERLLALTLALPVSAAMAGDFSFPSMSIEDFRKGAASSPTAPIVGEADPVASAGIVTLSASHSMIGAKSPWSSVPEGFSQVRIVAKTGPEDSEEPLPEGLTLEVGEVRGSRSYSPGKGTLEPDGNGSWTYTAFEEPRGEKAPATLSVAIVPKVDGRVVGEPAFLTVKTVFDNLSGFHAHDTMGKMHKADASDYELAWKYARWKHGIDTSNLSSIRYDPALTTMGLTRLGVGGIGRHCRLGPTAFNAGSGVCASVLGHENVHGGQSVMTLLSSRWAEPDAYQWELDNAQQTGISASYIAECRAFQDYYKGQGPRPD